MGIWFLRGYGLVLSIIALALILPGVYLITLGGTFYFFIAGALMLSSGACLFRRKSISLTLYAGMLVYTLLWCLYEAGLDFWAIASRLYLLSFLGLFLLLPTVYRNLEGDFNKVPYQALVASLLLNVAVTLTAYSSFTGGLSVDPDRFASRERSSASNAMTETNWLAYGNSRKGTKYSPADQINSSNVHELEVAWTYRTGIGGTFKNTPIQVGDKLYACGGGNVVIALNATTGAEVFRFDAGVADEVKNRAPYFTTTCRGVSFYEAPSDYAGECPARILMGTVDARLLAIDAATGAPCTTFGDNGQIDLKHKLGEVKEMFYFVTSSPAIVRGNAVVGGWVVDNQEINEPSGVVRAFNAITGEFAWAWDMGRPGIYTEPEGDGIYTRGTPNVWSLFSVDEENGLVFAPTGNETPDYFGALRHESSEKYASSLVAINGETGEPVWSFQTTHHDIWDYDVPAQPVLVDIPDAASRLVPAVVQATKRGELFLLNRLTGEPIAPVEERLVPKGGVPDDWTAPTQPFSSMPNVLAKGITEQDMWGISPFDQMACRVNFRKMRYEGHFTPPSTEPTYQYPGNGGGYNWGSVSVHEKQHIMVGNLMNLGNRTRLVPRAEMEAGTRGSPQLGTPYGFQTGTFVSPIGIPCNEPPFGMLVAVDLQSQDLLWQRAIGNGEELGGLPLEIGTPNIGGTIVTEGGLIFFGATMDAYLRALDLHTGAELWRHKLPNSAQAAPMTYIAPGSNEQMVVLAVPEKQPPGQRPSAAAVGEGGYLIAFRLAKK